MRRSAFHEPYAAGVSKRAATTPRTSCTKRDRYWLNAKPAVSRTKRGCDKVLLSPAQAEARGGKAAENPEERDARPWPLSRVRPDDYHHSRRATGAPFHSRGASPRSSLARGRRAPFVSRPPGAGHGG